MKSKLYFYLILEIKYIKRNSLTCPFYHPEDDAAATAASWPSDDDAAKIQVQE